MLKMTNVTKIFDEGTVSEKTAIDSIDLFIKEKDFITVIGGNGAGKSTLLNTVAGVFLPSMGEIFLDGENITNMPEYKRATHIGRVFQDTRMGTASNLSIEQNLSIARRRGEKRGFKLGLPQAESPIYREALKTLNLNLEDRVRTKVGLLSGGQRQALTLLMATIKKPKLLLLDEHTAALDPKTAKIVLELSEKLIEEQELTVLMVTHNMNEALRLGNRLIMMNNGKILFDINAEEKKKLTIQDLLRMFEEEGGDNAVSDRMLLS